MPSIYVPDAPPASAGSEDDEFADASGGVPGGWTEVDHGAVQTVTEDEAGLKLFQATHAGDALSGVYKAIPAGDFTYWTKVSISGLGVTTFHVGGIALWQDATSSSGDVVTFALKANALYVSILIERWNAYNVYGSGAVNDVISVDVFPTHLYMRVRRTGTTYAFDISSDGIGWQRLYSSTLAITPTHIGPMVNNSNTGADVAARFAFWRYAASDVGATGTNKGDRVTFTGGGGGGGGGGASGHAQLLLTGVG